MDIDPVDIPGVDEGSGEPATLVDLPPERRGDADAVRGWP
jgi:hypothetical protein